VVVKVGGERGFLEALVGELRAAAEEEAERVIAEAEEEAKRIVEEARAKAEALKEERRRRREEELRRRAAREAALKRLELRRRFWDELYSLAERALEAALEEACALLKSNLEYRLMYLQRGLERGVASMASPSLVVHPCSEDRWLVERLVSENWERLRKLKPGLRLTVGSPLPGCRHGFLLVSEDGREIFNAALEARRRELEQRLLTEVFKLIWGGVSG
jgi:V/A-type H+-transporting ATPase subunit E